MFLVHSTQNFCKIAAGWLCAERACNKYIKQTLSSSCSWRPHGDQLFQLFESYIALLFKYADDCFKIFFNVVFDIRCLESNFLITIGWFLNSIKMVIYCRQDTVKLRQQSNLCQICVKVVSHQGRARIYIFAESESCLVIDSQYLDIGEFLIRQVGQNVEI